MIIVGLGNIGSKRAGILRELGSEIVGVDPYVNKENFDFPVFDAIAEVPEDQLAIVCTPPTVRLGVVEQLIAHDVQAVLIEKPIAPTNEEGEAILDAKGNVQIYQAANWIYSPVYSILRDFPIRRSIQLDARANIRKWPSADYRSELTSQGVLWDMAPHSLYILERILKERIANLSVGATYIHTLEQFQGPHFIHFRGHSESGIEIDGICTEAAPHDGVSIRLDEQLLMGFDPNDFGEDSLRRELYTFHKFKHGALPAKDAVRHLKLLGL